MIELARNGVKPGGGRDTARLTWNQKGGNEGGGPGQAPRTIASYESGKRIDEIGRAHV